MPEDKKVNGWTNYETWCVNLWLDQSDNQATIASLEDGDALRFWCEQAGMFPAAEGGDCQADLITTALGEVNWDEILDAAKESEHEGLDAEDCDDDECETHEKAEPPQEEPAS